MRKIPIKDTAIKKTSVLRLKPRRRAIATCLRYPNPLAIKFMKEDLITASKTFSCSEILKRFFNEIIKLFTILV